MSNFVQFASLLITIRVRQYAHGTAPCPLPSLPNQCHRSKQKGRESPAHSVMVPRKDVAVTGTRYLSHLRSAAAETSYISSGMPPPSQPPAIRYDVTAAGVWYDVRNNVTRFRQRRLSVLLSVGRSSNCTGTCWVGAAMPGDGHGRPTLASVI